MGDAQPFLSGERIHHAREFLSAEEETPGFDPEAEREAILQEVRRRGEELASLGSLERHPGFLRVLEIIEEMRDAEEADAESLLERNDLSPEKHQLHLYARLRLKNLKQRLLDEIENYKDLTRQEQMIRMNQPAEEGEGLENA